MTSTAHMPQVTPKCPSVVTLLEVVGPRAVCLWAPLRPFHVSVGPQALGGAARAHMRSRSTRAPASFFLQRCWAALGLLCLLVYFRISVFILTKEPAAIFFPFAINSILKLSSSESETELLA